MRVFRTRHGLGRLPRIPLANQRIKIREDRSRHQEGVVLLKLVGFVSVVIAQQADHNLGGLAGARVGEGVLLGRQILVRPGPSANESGSQQRRPHRIHQAKPNRLEEAASFVKGAQRRPVQMPLFTAKLVEVHKTALSS